MLRSAQPSQFSTYPSQYIDTPGLAVLNKVGKGGWKIIFHVNNCCSLSNTHPDCTWDGLMGGQPGCQPRAFLFINKTSRGQKLTFDFNHGFKSIISGTRWLSSSSPVPGGWGGARGGQAASWPHYAAVMSGCRGRAGKCRQRAGLIRHISAEG